MSKPHTMSISSIIPPGWPSEAVEKTKDDHLRQLGVEAAKSGRRWHWPPEHEVREFNFPLLGQEDDGQEPSTEIVTTLREDRA